MDGGSRKPRPPYHIGGTRPRRGWFHCGYQHPPPGFHDPKNAAYLQGYGLGYQLCDNSTGVVNGNTRVTLLKNTVSVAYIGDKSVEHYHKEEDYPPSLERRHRGEDASPRECDNLVRLACLGSWPSTRSAISFYLTNGTVQINFFQNITQCSSCARSCKQPRT
ncbi:hypothetical protein HPB50_029029 [Hyalomma asiaticum]|nr:hypothetical protein HPB50_029029 [Hyalomma asiaticum]